jgi:hypothetical protein
MQVFVETLPWQDISQSHSFISLPCLPEQNKYILSSPNLRTSESQLIKSHEFFLKQKFGGKTFSGWRNKNVGSLFSQLTFIGQLINYIKRGCVATALQGCQMLYLVTDGVGVFYCHLVYFMAIWYISWAIGIFYAYLVYLFSPIWYVAPWKIWQHCCPAKLVTN